jgi:hypothetical protein
MSKFEEFCGKLAIGGITALLVLLPICLVILTYKELTSG